MTGIEKAIENAGGRDALARAVGVTGTAVYLWRQRGIVPAARVPAVEAAGKVPAHELNPLFGEVASARGAAA